MSEGKREQSRKTSVDSNESEESVSRKEKESLPGEQDEERKEVPEEEVGGNMSEYESAAEGEEDQGSKKDEATGTTVDDDQDRRNPQYIPKRGVFYEHDDRIDESEEEEESEDANRKKNRRVAKSETASRWGHDKFAEIDQAPKTKDELVSVYGYDIRNEDTAPRARRRRKYGRGPNKYTRKWENEDAYQKPTGRGGTGRGGGRGGGGGPGGGPNRSKKSDEPRHVIEEVDIYKNEAKGKPKAPSPSFPSKANNKPLNSKKDSFKFRPSGDQKPSMKDSESSRIETVEKSLSKAHIGGKPNVPRKQQLHEKQNSVSPASVTDSSSIKCKRYSTQRQRNSQPPPRKEDADIIYYKQASSYQQPSEYPITTAAYSNAASFSGTTAGAPHFNPPRSAPNGQQPPQQPTQTQSVPPPYINPNSLVNYGPPPPVQYTVPVTVPVTVPLTMSLVPPQPETFTGVPLVAAPNPTNPPLMPPTPHHMGTPELLAAAALSGGVPPPSAAGAPPNAGYAEVRGGVTYFNPTAQTPVMIRPVSKRPKAAIPIVDPSNLRNNENNGQDSTVDVETNASEVFVENKES